MWRQDAAFFNELRARVITPRIFGLEKKLRNSPFLLCIAISAKLAASMSWVEGLFRAFFALALVSVLLVKKYDKR